MIALHASFELWICRKNGKFVGSTPKDVKGSLFPTIGLHSPNEKYVFLLQLYSVKFLFAIMLPIEIPRRISKSSVCSH